MRCNLYVYFRVSDDTATLLAALQAMQQELRLSGVRASLARRRDDAATWMEIYEDIAEPEHFSQQLAEARSRHQLARWALARHEEWFVPLQG